jgi:hypothetical protein
VNLHLLIIEDEQSIIKDWEAKLELYSVESDPVYNIIPVMVKNLSEAEGVLSTSIFDAAVIDIRLDSKDGHPNKDGNILFKEISETTLAVTAVYTGEPEAVEFEEYQKDFIKVFLKGGEDIDIDSILEWLDSKKNMVAAIQKMKNSINIEMAQAFSKSIWPRWNYWLTASDNDQALTESALTRHMATRLHALFLNEGDQKVHPEEYYFIPPLRDELDTGDIFKDEHGKFKLLITPRCELAQDKHETLQFISLEDVSVPWSLKIKKICDATNVEKKRSAEESLRRYSNNNNNSASCHFVPQIRLSETEIVGPFFARFNQLVSIDKTKEEGLELLSKEKFACLSNEFIPSLVERLGSFFSRIGTPDYSHQE